jgi:hypothetical protein
MSTSLLYHTCGIRGYEYRSTEYICGTTVVHIEQPREKLRCPHCGRAEVSARGSKSRIFRSVPIGSKPIVPRFGWVGFRGPGQLAALAGTCSCQSS